MKNLKFTQKLALIMTILICLLISFQYWYNKTFPVDLNSHSLDQKLLIVKQSSPFKDSISAVISDHYKSASVVVKNIDVATLPTIDAADFDAIIILFRWEARAPHENVQSFIDKNSSLKNNIVILTTSWNGLEKMENVDAITGASVVENVPTYTAKIIKRLDPLLKSKY